MQARFLLGPAGSGKTFLCLAQIRAALLAAPDGPPLILLAPKQATFQLERQLLADPAAARLAGYTRLHILSFERLAKFILDKLRVAPPNLLSEEGRVMVLRALLIRHQSELKIFRASARLTGLAQQLSLLLREFQRHQLSPVRLDELASKPDAPPQLRAKLHDLGLLLRAYTGWLDEHGLHDADLLLGVALEALRGKPADGGQKSDPRSRRREEADASGNGGPIHPPPPHAGGYIAELWFDGFAEMTPQELDLLAAVMPFSERATLAFCLKREPESEPSWLSPWSVVAQTFRRCHARLAAMDDVRVSIETLTNEPGKGRFAASEKLRSLEANWSQRPAIHDSRFTIHDDSIRLVECPDTEAEAVFAAREILRHVRTGGRYRECAVIVRSLEPFYAVLARVFRRYGIPVFMDRREAVAHHPLAELTRFAVRTVWSNWRHDDWFGTLKTGFAPASDEKIDELENEALAFGWEGKVWRAPLPEGRNRFEELRRQLVAPFENFAAALAVNDSKPTGAQLATAVRNLWRELNVKETLQQWNVAANNLTPDTPHPAPHTTVFDQINDWLENLERAFPTESLSLRDWLPILEAGLANLSVGVVPPALDQVLVGAIDRSRNPDLKLALVLGLNERVFPAPPAPGTLLTEADRAGLESANVHLGPTTRQRLGQERYLGYIACTRASERLVLTFAAQDADGEKLNPSPFLDQIKQITGVSEEKFNGPGDWLEAEHVGELAAPVLVAADERRRISSENGVPLPHVGGYDTEAQGSLLELALLPALVPLVEKWRQVKPAGDTGNLSVPTVEKIFGRKLKTSVSGLEDFAACPFRFFAARGLRLKERKEFQFDDRDKGSFQHQALERFHEQVRASGRQWRDLTPSDAGKLAAEIGRALLKEYEGGKFETDGAARFTGGVLLERLRRLVVALVEWMPQYGFDPAAGEIAFDDENGSLPSWRIDLGNAYALLLRGRIDRVDLIRLPDETALAVVMDYKSRVRKLDATKLHHGLELQLLSYLGVLKHLRTPEKILGVKSLAPAGVFYIPLNGGGGKGGATRKEILSADEAERRAAYQHSGRFLGDELAHFDNRGHAKGDQFKYTKNKGGDFSKRGNEAMPAAEFEALREKVEGHLRDYGRRIFSGEASVSPFRIGNVTACDYCEFRAVCRFDPWTQPFRTLRPPPKKEKSR